MVEQIVLRSLALPDWADFRGFCQSGLFDRLLLLLLPGACHERQSLFRSALWIGKKLVEGKEENQLKNVRGQCAAILDEF
jgi:hypothetical protein